MTSVPKLRRLTPRRPLSEMEALRLAELQANRLLELFEVPGPPVPISVISHLPKIYVEELPSIPVSGSAHWDGALWIIVLSADEPETRRRFSLAHELKHVLDHPFRFVLYANAPRRKGQPPRMEVVADHFAACLLMPKRWIYAAWNAGIRDVRDLATFFEVSRAAMERRITDLGLAPMTNAMEAA